MIEQHVSVDWFTMRFQHLSKGTETHTKTGLLTGILSWNFRTGNKSANHSTGNVSSEKMLFVF
jgi:hypothetical protein